jgi:hypothetical protein
MWMTPVRTPPPFACDRGAIVFAYKEYQRVMAHWRQVIPPSSLLEVDYEEITGNGRSEIGRILSFLDLEWDDACLRPEENARSVRTPSFWQVRQPLYTSSVARWKRYEPYLGEFGELV